MGEPCTAPHSLWIQTLSLLLAYFITMPTGLSSADIAHSLCHVPPQQASQRRASASASAAEYEENDLLLAIFHQELGL